MKARQKHSAQSSVSARQKASRDTEGAGNNRAVESARLSSDSSASTMSGSRAVAALSGALRGGGTEVPYREEMEDFFGQDFADVTAYVGVDLTELDAKGAALGDTIAFDEASPDKKRVVHELTHIVQGRGGEAPSEDVALDGGGGGLAGTTSRGESAEKEASSVASAFSSGAIAPNISASVAGVARDGEGGTALEQLRAAASGNWLGDVDEGDCLRLINQLTPSEKSTVTRDTTLMSELCGALDEMEIVQAVTSLGMDLAWKAHWIHTSGEAGAIGAARWQQLVVTAPRSEQEHFLNWASFPVVKPYLQTTPIVLFAAQRGSAVWGNMLCCISNLVTWLVESADAASVLKEIGGPNVAAGDIAGIVARMRTTGDWATLMAGCPTGSGLDAVTRVAMKKIVDNVAQPTASELFQKRFNTIAEGRSEDASAGAVAAGTAGATVITWAVADLRAVWTQLDVLPDQDVSDNTVIRAWQAISGDRGFYSGPDAGGIDTGTIQIGDGLRTSAGRPDRLGHTVRHEVGHAVHASMQATIDSWLQNGVGFWYFAEGTAGLQSLITDLGGFPATYQGLSDTAETFTAADQTRMLELLVAHVNSNKWAEKTAMPDINLAVPTAGFLGPPSPDQTDALLYRAMPSLRNCCEQSKSYWYQNYTTHQAGPKGRYFLNHWYSKPYYFSNIAQAAITATGDNYSAMSYQEFFANCYAEFFKDPAGYTDHSLWGGSLGADVKGWIRTHILERQPYAPPAGGGAGANTPHQAPGSGMPGTP